MLESAQHCSYLPICETNSENSKLKTNNVGKVYQVKNSSSTYTEETFHLLDCHHIQFRQAFVHIWR